MDIREAIRSLAGQAPSPLVVGVVTATDGQTADIQPLDDDAPPLLGIDLGLAPGAALALRPPVGATVLVALDSPATGVVLAAGRAPVVINGGANGPMVNIGPLRRGLDKMTARIDALYDALRRCGASPQGGALHANILAALATVTPADREDFDGLADQDATH